jgi:predicted MFS family arabinose efflux permease
VVTQVLVTIAADTAQPERRGRTIGAVASGAVLRTSGVLRRACLYGALTFAAFSVLWSTLAQMLAGPPYRVSEGIIGLFGLAAAGGARGARGGGRLFDRGHGPTVTVAALGLGSVAFALVATGRSSLAALVIGVLAVDFACQLVQITNQGTIFELDDQRSRLTSVYMTSRFAGGAVGSAVGTALFGGFGWVASSLAGSALFATALVVCAATAGERRAQRVGSAG